MITERPLLFCAGYAQRSGNRESWEGIIRVCESTTFQNFFMLSRTSQDKMPYLISLEQRHAKKRVEDTWDIE